MKKKKRLQFKIITQYIGAIVFAIATLLYLNRFFQFQLPAPITKMNEYHVEQLGFYFEAPSKYNVTQSINTLELENGDEIIKISKLYGYSETAESYLQDLAEKNHLRISIEGQTPYGYNIAWITGAQSTARKTYFKNIDDGVFVSISTTSPDLYDDLDHIAQSFRYEGE